MERMLFGVDLDVLGVGRGDLESVEEEAGAFGVELMGGEGLEDFDERELDRGAVFDRGELERETGRLCIRTPVRVESGRLPVVTCFDGVDALVDDTFRDIFARSEGAVGEPGLTAGIAAAALGFLRDALCLLGLLFMEACVEVAPVVAFNRCCVAAITTRSYVPALRIHFIFLFRLALNSAGVPPPSPVRCGRSSYNPSLAIKI
jgi:hypothetical protein